jgi:hypothetical protein
MAEFARHCEAEDTDEYAVYEVDGGDLVTTLKNAVKFIDQLEYTGATFEASYEASTEPGDDYFEVVIFKVSK